MNQYEIARNTLIPGAAEYADRVVGKIPIRGAVMTEKADEWNKVYHARMNELSLRAGLTPWLEKRNEKR
jgi:hypothetical protein